MSDTPTPLSLDEVRARIKERTETEAIEVAETTMKEYRYLKPLELAAEGLIEYASNPEGRFMLGQRDVDAMTRGFGRGELVYVTGRAHSGKTQVVLNAIVQNPNKHVILFTPDEVAELVLSKLVSIKHGINAEEAETRIRTGDREITELMRRAARVDFRNLVVIDESLTLKQMTDALNEAQDHWGEQADLAVVDFLELIPGEDGADGVVAKSQGLKRWTKNADLPTICLHQASRSSGNRGQAAGMGAMRYGGETEAIFVLEVYRKREDEQLDDFDRRRHANTVTVNLAKNKRPPSKIGEVDLFMDPNTGLIRTLHDDDMVVLNAPLTTAAQAVAASSSTRSVA